MGRSGMDHSRRHAGGAAVASASEAAEPGANPVGRAERLMFHSIMVLLLVVLCAAGYGLLRHRQESRRAWLTSEFEAIVRLKADRIRDWHRERWADAQAIRNAPFLGAHAHALAAGTADPALRAALAGWLRSVVNAYGYGGAVLLDASMRPLLSEPESVADRDSSLREWLRTLPPDVGQVWSAMHRDDAGAPHLDLYVPIPESDRAGRPGGVLLRIDPRRNLFPMLRDTGADLASCEFILLQRGPGRLSYLSGDLGPGRPAEAGVPGRAGVDALCQRVVEGRERLVEATDHRGIPSLGTGRPIPDTTWYLVVRMDRAVFEESLSTEAWKVGGMGVSVLLFAGTLLGIVWRRRREQLRRQQHRANEERLRLATRLGLIMEHARDAIIILDADRRIIEVNDRAVELLGYSRDELQGMHAREVRATGQEAAFEAELAATHGPAGALYETVHRRKDGTTLPMEVSARAVQIDGALHYLSVLREISERKAHERQLERLSRLHRMLSQVNQAIA